MQLKLIRVGARYAAIELVGDGRYYTGQTYELFLDGKLYARTNRTVNLIYDLLPASAHRVSVGEAQLSFVTEDEFVTLNVRRFGAHGDGVCDDTVYFQAAISACPPKGRVLVPRGTYKITNLFFKSGVRMELSTDAVLLADRARFSHPIFPGMLRSYDETEEYQLGTWEGNPLPMFAGILSAIDASDIEIYGRGLIHGNATPADWWYDEKTMRGAFRPRLMFFERCKRVAVIGVRVCNSPSWTIHPYYSDDVDIIGISAENPMDSPNTDGVDIDSCCNVRVIGADFTLGDDCVAVKSGKIYMANHHPKQARNIFISRCLMQQGHGAVTVGSEISAGVSGLTVESCEFVSTDRGLRIKTRRGRGNTSIIDGVIFRDIVMRDVATPLVMNSFYFCDPDGRTEYVQCRKPLPVDERTPSVKKLTFSQITCTGARAAAAFFYGLPERPIEEICLTDVHISFAEQAAPAVPAMLCGVGEMAKRGLLVSHVERLVLENVRLEGVAGKLIEADHVGTLIGEAQA